MSASKPTHSEASSVMKSVRLQSRTICAPATSKTNVKLPSGGWGHHKLNRRADGGGGRIRRDRESGPFVHTTHIQGTAVVLCPRVGFNRFRTLSGLKFYDIAQNN